MTSFRRANGDGTIYKRRDGRYEAAAYVDTVSGQRKRIRIYRPTHAQARQALTEALRKTDVGQLAPDHSWTVTGYIDYWLDSIVKISRRPATYAQCEQISRLYLKPALGQVPLVRLSAPSVQTFLNGLLRDGRSVALVQIVRKVLSSALTSAVREEVITRNVARLAVLPTPPSTSVTPWTADEATAFLRAASADPLYPAFLLLVLYGLRRGEVLGLRWSDIDSDQRTVRIHQQVQRVGRKVLVGPVKTSAGRRDLPLLSAVATVLQRHYETGLSVRTGVGQPRSQRSAGDLVFATGKGQPLEPSTFVRAFKRVCRTHGVRLIRVHDVRHTTATLLKQLGVPARDAQLILGHARVTTTQQIYQHDDLATRVAALGKLSAAILPSPRYFRHRSRHLSRQATKKSHANMAREWFITEANRGAGKGTLTLGLVLGKSKRTTFPNTLTEVTALANARYEVLMLGGAAVMFSRQSDKRENERIAQCLTSIDWTRVDLAPSNSC